MKVYRYWVKWADVKESTEQDRIDSLCFPFSADDPWVGSQYKAGKCVVRVIDHPTKHKVIGYCAWRAQVYHIEIFRLCILPEERRQGLGKALLNDVENFLTEYSHPDRINRANPLARSLCINVKASAIDAQVWLRGQGFIGHQLSSDVVRFVRPLRPKHERELQ